MIKIKNLYHFHVEIYIVWNIIITINTTDISNTNNTNIKFNTNRNVSRSSRNKRFPSNSTKAISISNNLIDDNLKVMFNFSYENFLSKESEHESKN